MKELLSGQALIHPPHRRLFDGTESVPRQMETRKDKRSRSNMAAWSWMSCVCLGTLIVFTSNSVFHASAQLELKFYLCGGTASFQDPNTTLDWQPDSLSPGLTYDTGSATAAKVDPVSLGLGQELRTLRYFPDTSKSEYCYYIPVTPKTPYFVRGSFFHGGYDGTSLNSTMNLTIPITIDGVFLQTLYLTNSTTKYGFTFILSTEKSNLTVCIGRHSNDIHPFLSTLETKQFYQTLMYPQCDEGRILTVVGRSNQGATGLSSLRYPDDRWDRTWQPAKALQPDNGSPLSVINVNGTDINTRPVFETKADPLGWNYPPDLAMDDAVTCPLSSELEYRFAAFQHNLTLNQTYTTYLYFRELDPTVNVGDRVFNISLNNKIIYSNLDILNHTTDRAHGLQLKLDLPPGYDGYVPFNYSLKATASSKFGPLLNAAESIGVSEIIPRGTSQTKSKVGVIVGTVVGGILVVIGVLLMVIWYMRRKRRAAAKYGALHRPMRVPPPRHRSGSSTDGDHGTYKEVKSYTYDQVVTMTKNWKEELGKGGFGTVYLGVLPHDAKDSHEPQKVALKKLSTTSHQGTVEFLNEVDLLSRVHHSKLVCLVGYCEDPNQQVLIYEYVEEGALDEWLYGSRQGNPHFDWDRRLHIALDAALGLEYLHTGAKPNIIHRDVKSSNILLTKNWEGRVADFGLSKTGSDAENKGHVSTMVKGTIGYLDPEYYGSARLTNKSDVYSFGVVLLEMVTGRRPLDTTVLNPDHRTVGRFVGLHYPEHIESVVDPRLNGVYNRESVCKIVDIALRSLAVSSLDRPNMNEVVAEIRIAIKLETGKGTLSGHSSGMEGSGDKLGNLAWGDATEGLLNPNSGQWSKPTSSTTHSIASSVPDNASSIIFPR